MSSPAGEYVPAEHVAVTAEEEQEEPAGHSVQEVADAAAYVPAVQGSTRSRYVTGQAEPAGQAVQAAVLPSEYRPTAHTTGAAEVVAHE